jgi:hypothetical protein
MHHAEVALPDLLDDLVSLLHPPEVPARQPEGNAVIQTPRRHGGSKSQHLHRSMIVPVLPHVVRIVGVCEVLVLGWFCSLAQCRAAAASTSRPAPGYALFDLACVWLMIRARGRDSVPSDLCLCVSCHLCCAVVFVSLLRHDCARSHHFLSVDGGCSLLCFVPRSEPAPSACFNSFPSTAETIRGHSAEDSTL